MANKINSSDLFEKDLFEELNKAITESEAKLKGFSDNLGKIGAKLKEELNGLDVKNLNSINEILKKNKEIEKSLQSQFELEKEQLKLQAQKEKLQIQLDDLKKKSQAQEEARAKNLADKEVKKLAKEAKEADNLANAYKRLEKNTRELKNESKRLGAEMLELEKAGKRNTKEYANLENQYKQTTKSAQEGDKALKKLDNTVGDNFRSVGNYGKALGGLKKVMQNIGYAFGVFEAINFVKQLGATQVKLDSLKLSLQNVSDGTNEFTRNMAFVVNISKQYGQDLLSTIDTYKNFIASTKDSNLALGERQMIYESLIKSTASLALSNEDTEGTLRAVQQMFAKGKIQAEELTQQLGDRLPSATRIMAKAVGVGTAELFKMMKNGELLADEVMPRFAQILEEEVGKNAEKRLQTIGGAFNLLRTNMTLYIDELQSSFNVNRTFSWFIVKIAKNIDGIISLVGKAIRYWTEYKLAMVAVNTTQLILNGGFKQLAMNLLGISSKLKNVSDEAEKSAKASSMLKNAIAGISVGVLAEIAYQLYRIGSGAEMAEDAMQRLNYQTGKGAEKSLKIVQDGYKKYYDTVAELRDKLAKKQITQTQFKAGQKQAQQEFTDFLGGNTETIKKRREEIQRDYDLLLSARKRLVEIQKNSQNYTTAELNNAKDTYVAQSNDIAQKYKIKKAWQDNIFVMNGAMKVEGQLIAFIKSLYGEEKNLSDEIKNVNANMGKNAKANEKTSYSYKPLIKDLKTVEIEYKTINDYLQDHINLLNEIELYNSERGATVRATQFEDEFKRQMEEVQVNGQYNLQVLGKLKKEEQNFLIDAEKKQTEIVIKQRKDEFEKRTKSLEESLEKEKQDYLSNFAEQQIKLATAEENLSRATYNLKNEKVGSKKYAKDTVKIKQLKEEADTQRKIYDDLTKETLTKFDQRSTELQKARASESKEIGRWEVQKAKELEDKITDIKKKAFDEWTQEEKDLIYAHDEWRLNNIKKLSNSTNDLIQMGMDAYVKTLERNISLVEDRMNRLNQSIDFLQQKAATGNITANESLAKAQEDQLNAEKEKAKFQRTIQRMQFAMTIFNAYNSNIQNAKVGENPFTKTITDISALTAFVGSLPTFYEGTDTTIKDALGNPHLQGKDGYVVRVDGSEKVLNPYLSAKTGNLTTRDIAQIAEDRLKGKLVYGNEINSTANNMWANMQLIDEIQDLKSIIKNKPETNIAMGEIVGGVMKIVETTKVSNTTTRNIHRFNKKI